MDQRVLHVIAFMHRKLRQKITLFEMAQTVYLTPEHLCRIFKAETGVPPARYLKRIRMREAKRLLGDSFLSVKEIAVAVGIKDESHFVRDFKAFFGLTPTQCRLQTLGDSKHESAPAAMHIKIS